MQSSECSSDFRGVSHWYRHGFGNGGGVWKLSRGAFDAGDRRLGRRGRDADKRRLSLSHSRWTAGIERVQGREWRHGGGIG